MKKRSRKAIDHRLCKGPPKQTMVVENIGLSVPTTSLVRWPERGLIQRISESRDKMSYKKGAIFFSQGQRPSGIFLMLEGAAKLSIASSDGKALVLGFVGPGTILGFAATILGKTHEATASAVGPTTAIFMERGVFLKLVQENTKMAFEAAELLSESCFKLLHELRIIGLSRSAQQRLATFLLGLDPNREDNGASISMPGTSQEDLAQMVGLSRETASRLLSRLKKRRVLAWKRSTLVIHNWGALRKLTALPE